ncbi:MAG: DNA polymerase III subunit epsilon [Rubrimonas sp.]
MLDPETTGLNPLGGDRVVEIGAVELMNHVATGRIFHVYINPQRPMNPEAEAVHGLSDAFLADKPVFAAIAEEFEAFVGEDRLVIHNAPFDMGFLNAERARLGKPAWPMSKALDTIAIARRRFPGAQANLDALCRRFGVDNSGREKHGALLDAELLAEVYLELIGGRQPDFGLSASASGAVVGAYTPPPRPRPLPPLRTEAEAEAHAAFVAGLGEGALWRKFDA